MTTQTNITLPVSVTCNIGVLMNMLTPVAYSLAYSAAAKHLPAGFHSQYRQPNIEQPCKLLEEYAKVLLGNSSAHDFFVKSSVPLHNPVLNGVFLGPDIARVYSFLVNTFEPRAYYEWVDKKPRY
jgi:hypothetical protein